MLKGDLASTPLTEVLRQLADGGATGCLHVVDTQREPDEDEAKAYLRGGRVYAVVVPGRRPTLGARLVTSGALGPEALAEALEAQATELQGWRLGELLVHLGYVDQDVVEAFVKEQIFESASDLLQWTSGTWRFRVNQKNREDVAPPVDVKDLLAEVARRREAWQQIRPLVGGPDAVPVLSAAGNSDDEMVVDGDAWSLLCKVDGARTIGELARDCGLTLFEAGHVIHTLVQSGLLEVDVPEGPEADDEPDEVESFVPADVASRLAGAFGAAPADDDEPAAPLVPAQGEAPESESSTGGKAPREEPPRALKQRKLVDPDADDEVEHSISRVSQALSAMLGATTAGDDLFAIQVRTPKQPKPSPEDEKKAERTRRDAVRRERDAAELAAAQAELEATKAADEARRAAELDDDHVADVVDLKSRRDAGAEAEAEAAEAEAAEAARRAEKTEAAHLAQEAEAARLAEEAGLAAEAEAEAARLAEEARLAAEAEAARLAEDARLAAEAEAARLAEDARLAAEAEAARLEQEAETARLAEEAEAARLAEEARLADEAEAARVAEEAEAARLEQTRAAAAAEVARLAAEAEQVGRQRYADEQAERERLAQESEQAAAEQAAAEQAAAEQAEAARVAAETPLFTSDPDQFRDDAAQQAAAFAELSAAATVAAPEPQPEPEREIEPAASAVMVDDEPPLPSFNHDTDTAALLRELTSLGLDEDAPPPPTTRPVGQQSRPVPVQAQKKRKGLFGRG